MRRVIFLVGLAAVVCVAGCGDGGGVMSVDETAAPNVVMDEDAIVVDETQMELEGAWRHVEVAGALGEACVWAAVNPVVPNEWDYEMYDSATSAYAYVRPALAEAGTYEIFARRCAPPGAVVDGAMATVAELQVHPTRGRVAYTPVTVNMTRDVEQWVSLGRFYLERDGFVIVSNAEGDVNGAVVVDGFAFAWRSAEREGTPPGAEGPAPPEPSRTP